MSELKYVEFYCLTVNAASAVLPKLILESSSAEHATVVHHPFKDVYLQETFLA